MRPNVLGSEYRLDLKAIKISEHESKLSVYGTKKNLSSRREWMESQTFKKIESAFQKEV